MYRKENRHAKKYIKSGIALSELGLGCMSLGTDLKKAEQIIDCAVENGITYFDTADMYDKGINESVVGKALLEISNNATTFHWYKSRQSFRKDCSTTWDPSKILY